jgi:hypothetical protein
MAVGLASEPPGSHVTINQESPQGGEKKSNRGECGDVHGFSSQWQGEGRKKLPGYQTQCSPTRPSPGQHNRDPMKRA